MDKEQLWQAVLGELEISLSKANFTTWFKNTFVSALENGKVVIGVPNTFTKAWLEKKYHSAIIKALQNITDNKITEVNYIVKNPQASEKEFPFKKSQLGAPKAEATAQKISQTENTKAKLSNLNPRYTFENFIVGKGNELAQAAAVAVAEKPGLVYNPLFIYGGVGLGKTHLMQAIGHKALENFPDKKILYVACEKFTNEFIQAISTGKGEQFKNTYRAADVLLIDDIQFLAGKEGTQVEFFHTFNALHQDNKQIVISSDRPPKAIPALENRLISRFEWGMIVDISAPDLETRLAILEIKCREKDYKLDRDILSYIATHVQNNIRELEGTLNRITAYHELNNSAPTLESVKNLISSITTRPKKGAVTPKQITAIVAEFFDVNIEDLMGASRKKELVTPRQIVMFLMREEIRSSYPAIGHELGGRDHTTAMHAHNKITREINSDEKMRQDIELIRQRIYHS